jgi:NADPH-dependent 2,4-dienoyl-CoA reductase/sulfur reductase-like enzyme/rhodanese-related sulfurtransferase
MKVVIIGGVAGGATTAARLRRLDEHAEIVILERGSFISYANCGLPYFVGGSIEDREDLELQTPASFNARFAVDVRARSEAVKIDTAAKTVTVKNLDSGETVEEAYDNLVIAPGASANVPAFVPRDDERIFTLRTIPDAVRIKEYVLMKKPKTAIVVGGGFIGLEVAENLIERGLDVTLVGRASHVLPNIDTDVAWDVHRHLKQNGLKLMCGVSLKGVGKGENSLIVETSAGDLETDLLVMAAGIRPDTKIVSEAGIACDAQGYILVDEAMRTSAEGVYAVGDAVTVKEFLSGTDAHVALAGPANRQARIVADRIAGIPSVYKGSQRSFIIKLFDKTLAATGMTEKFALSQGFDCEKVHLYLGSHAGYYPGANMIAIKLLFDRKTGKVLGGQFFGAEGTDKRTDVLAAAIRAGMTVSELCDLELCYAPPYSSAKDPVNIAGMAAENIVTGKVKVFHWENLGELDPSAVTLLDVRESGEYKRGSIEGFMNIPLSQFRAHLGELDPTKPVYVHCFSGMRSYIACRILTGHGFDCCNISGGYRLYAAKQDFES